MQRTILAAALGLLAACAPETTAPVRVQALVYNGSAYVPQEVQLTTVSDIVRMEGAAAKIIGGARIRSDPNDPELQGALTEDALGNALIKSSGRPVTANFINHEGVLWPADFHTWNIVTAYFNFEKSFDYFRIVGNIPSAELSEPTLYYFPEFTLADVSTEPLKDNALFFAPVQAFMVLPFESLQKAPLAINSGIMAHEYAHIVFNKKVYGGRRLPEPIIVWGGGGAAPAANLIKALDEGLADYHAFGVTCTMATGCDPRFLRTSFDDKLTGDRDLSRNDRCMTFELREQLQTAPLGNFTGRGLEYQLGSIIASALYQAGGSPDGHKVLTRSLVSTPSSAYSDENPNNLGLAQLARLAMTDQNRFNLTSVSAVIIKHVPEGPYRTAVCNELIDHLQIPAAGVAELLSSGTCPPEAQGGNTCPKLP
jgi:hypothetical protein